MRLPYAAHWLAMESHRPTVISDRLRNASPVIPPVIFEMKMGKEIFPCPKILIPCGSQLKINL